MADRIRPTDTDTPRSRRQTRKQESKVNKTLQEFKEFVSRGNVIDLAVGVLIGGAFTAIVNALVNNLFMPFLGVVSGNIDYSTWEVPFFGAQLALGNIITAIINFLIIAIILFIMIKLMERLYRNIASKQTKEEIECPYCCMQVHKDATRCPYCTSKITPQKYDEPLNTDVF